MNIETRSDDFFDDVESSIIRAPELSLEEKKVLWAKDEQRYKSWTVNISGKEVYIQSIIFYRVYDSDKNFLGYYLKQEIDSQMYAKINKRLGAGILVTDLYIPALRNIDSLVAKYPRDEDMLRVLKKFRPDSEHIPQLEERIAAKYDRVKNSLEI